ncbi:hypothetical protein CWE08_05550 [Aliidiomarina iranensis]|uniref:Uncharacterized protein n=1 Tax=Aliidiomarina iranensis TaxID=1434071 RepID=A0A432W0T3_9GAMM|nr:hypothetical protein CWE08_05550 [Aliidiomarina iranensis]
MLIGSGLVRTFLHILVVCRLIRLQLPNRAEIITVLSAYLFPLSAPKIQLIRENGKENVTKCFKNPFIVHFR